MTKAIQMAIEEMLLEPVDSTSNHFGFSRSAFIRQALRETLERARVAELERTHAAGYTRHPVEAGEFDVWQGEQVWGDV